MAESKMFNKTTKRWVKAYKAGTSRINLVFTRAVKRGDQFTNLPKNIAIDRENKKVIKIYSNKGKFTKLFKDAVKQKTIITNTNVQYNKLLNPDIFIDTTSNKVINNPYVKSGTRKGLLKKKYINVLQNKTVNLETNIIESTTPTQAQLNVLSNNKIKKGKGGIKQLQGTRFFKQYRVQINGSTSYENIYEKVIEFQNQEKWGNINLILYFKDNTSNKVQPFVVHQDNLKSFSDFFDYITAVRGGNQVVAGSDQYFTDDYTPIMDYFDIGIMKIANATGNGKSDKLIWKNQDINGWKESGVKKDGSPALSEGRCGYKVIEKIVGVDRLKKYMFDNNVKERSFTYYNNIKKCLDDLEIKYELIYNSFQFINSETEYNIFNRSYEESKDKYGRKMLLYPLLNSDIISVGECGEMDFINEGEKIPKILFDVSNEHFDLIQGDEVELCDDIYIGSMGLYKKIDDKFEFLMSYSFVNKHNKSVQLKEKRYLIFDYETVIDFDANSCMKEFACSWLDVNEDDLKELDQIEKGKGEMTSDEWYKKNSCVVDDTEDYEDKLDDVCGDNRKKVFNCISYDCSKYLTDYICYNQTENEIRYILIGFNNSNFDNYILADHVLERHHNLSKDDEWQPKINEDSIMYNGSELLRFKINGCHEVFDIKKHIVGSLKNCCKDFKIESFAKQDCDDYDLWTELHDKKCLMEKVKNDKNLIKYNDFDVISTGLVFFRYEMALKQLDNCKDIKLTDYSTMGQVIWKIAQDYWKDGDYATKFPLLSWDQYQTLQQNKIAGRVEMFNGVQKFLGDAMMSLDVCSLYPFVCCVYNQAYYPHGEIIDDPELNIKTIGQYTKFITTNVPNEKMPNFDKYYSMIELVRMMGYDEQKLIDNIKDFCQKMYKYEKEYDEYGIVFEQISKKVRNYKIIDEKVWENFKSMVLSWKICDINKRSNPICFFKCDVDQSILKTKNLPLIYALKKKDKNGNCIENLWGHDDYIIKENGDKQYAWDLKDITISNVVIEQLFKYGCKIHIKSGFHFTRKEKGLKMFGFIKDMMKAKNEQDVYKAQKDWTNYNQALRTTLKLLQNAISGRVIMGLHPQQKKLITSEEQLHKLHEQEQKGKIKNLSAIKPLGNALFVQYEKNEEDLIKKQKPIYLGVLIYDYAKTYMYEYSYSKIGLKELTKTDTDASKLRAKYGQKYIDEYASITKVPAWDELKIDHPLYKHGSKVYGSLENEFEEDEFIDELNKKDKTKYNVDDIQDRYFCVVQKKCYMYSIKVNGEWKINKDWFRFKGVNPDSILLDTDNLPDFILKKYKNKDKKNESYKYQVKCDYDDDAIKQRKLFDFYRDRDGKSVLENAIKFFEQIHVNKKAIVLAQSFRKITRNNKSLDVLEDHDDAKYENNFNKVQVSYCVKNIKI